MLYLLLATICSSSIALLFKMSESRNLNRYVVTSANYVAALGVGLFLWCQGSVASLPDDLTTAGDQIVAALESGRQITDAGARTLWGIGVGFPAGIVFFLGFVFYQVSVRRHSVGLAGSFAKMGIFVPMVLALVIWREALTTTQSLGLCFAAAAILAACVPWRLHARRNWHLALIFLLLTGGLAEFSNKVFQRFGDLESRPAFLVATFGTALVCSIIATFLQKKNLHVRDVFMGLAVGVPNLFSSFFLIEALDHLPAAVAFPLFGAGTILLVSVAGLLLFGERLRTKELLAIVLSLVGIVLVGV